MAPSTASQLTAEFVGTFLLVFTVGCNVLGNSGAWAGVSIACVLMVCIYSFGGISGANFNPAVSVGLGLSKQFGGNGMEWQTVALYCVTQIIAGISAALCYTVLYQKPFNLHPAKGFGGIEACICEMIYTCMLVFVVLNVAAARKYNETGPPHWFGLAIGFVIVAGAYGAGPISGGCFNPAVAFGIDVSSALLGFGWCLVYTIAELIGAVIAVFLFTLVRPGDFGTAAEGSNTPMLVSEFFGTFMLVFTVGLNVLGKSPAAAFSIAASLMCMIYALGDVSGAHFNPAVTLAIKASRQVEMDGRELTLRMLIQIAGGLTAGMAYEGIYSKSFPLGPVKPYNWSQVAIAEVTFTCVLCLVVLCTAVSSKTKSESMFGLAIGSCVTVGGFAIGGVSGGSLNPAVSMGISGAHMLNGQGFFFHALVYALLEFAGGAIAAVIFSVTHADTEMAALTAKKEEQPTVTP